MSLLFSVLVVKAIFFPIAFRGSEETSENNVILVLLNIMFFLLGNFKDFFLLFLVF